MSVTVIKQQLLNSLNAMGSLKAAFAYEGTNPSGKYPYATLTIDKGNGQFASNSQNLRKHNFWIRVYQEQSKQGQGIANAEAIAIIVLDELNAHLDLNTTLSGSCKYALPTNWRANYVDRELDTRILEINVEAFEITNTRNP